MRGKTDNLIPGAHALTVEEQSKAGKKSVESRRRKKTMKQTMEALLSLPASEVDLEMLRDMGVDIDALGGNAELNNQIVVNAALLNNAKMGDVASIKELRSITQDDAYLKLQRDRLKFEREKTNPSSTASNNLFDAINNCAKEDCDDLPEFQQAAADDADVVE